MLSFSLVIAALLFFTAPAFAFNGQKVTEGALTLGIAEVPTVTAFEAPQTCEATLTNAGDTALTVALRLDGLIDTTHAIGPVAQNVSLPPHGSATVRFQFACASGTFSALYPIHVHADFTDAIGPHTAHAVQIFRTDFAAASAAQAAKADLAAVAVPASGAFALANVKQWRVGWSYVGGDLTWEPVGWTGTDATSAANFSRAAVTRAGVSRATLQMHPAYRPKPGTTLVEYRLKLPATTPIRLQYFNAIRDNGPTEPPSDGVTFRVWVDGTRQFERHTAAKTWVPGEVDLSSFAGREIRLRLESHPGPKNNTVCDSSYWGDPVITVGTPPKMATAEESAALAATVRALLAGTANVMTPTMQSPTGTSATTPKMPVRPSLPEQKPATRSLVGAGVPAGAARSDGGWIDGSALVYILDGGVRAVVAPGPNGLLDGVIGFGNGEHQVLFSGLYAAVEDSVVGVWPSAAVVESIKLSGVPNGVTRISHHLSVNGHTAELIALIWREGPALRIKVESDARITALALNPADQTASRVFYGHGYCVVEPSAFRARLGGHDLATSHVGFEFERGVSLLMASDTPPDWLQVDPARRVYQLQTHPDATLTFVPGFSSAFDCAVRYRPLYDKKPAAGVAKKAGRFVFDLWGGRYADDTAKLARAFSYGLTDSLVVMHNWQRWGYDYRLPDIFPPQPGLGTLEDLQALGKVCAAQGVLWGLHDNYIDFYPDATGFSYDHITFNEDGQPKRAWLNEGREAQSYQFRPDHLRPFLARNLSLIVPALHPTASFVDVFSSMPPFDFQDRDGKRHSKIETRQAWGDAFATIRNALGNDAPTISEAGGDYLVGWLDGADAQMLQLSTKSAPFHNAVTCRDWERVPWFDVVNHTRFSLHGAGYSDRYQGGRSREEHGIESDDYITSELLTGHALMIDLNGLGRGAVRKYWLAQDFIASVAHDDIRTFEFAGGDIHRAVVTWNSGARVCVNRGAADWTVEGHVLPQYGYWAKNGAIESSVERFGSEIAEQSRGPKTFYCNSRVFNPSAPLAITPSAERVEYVGGRQFRLLVDWDVQRTPPVDCTVFYHFSRPTPGRRAMTEFMGGGMPSPRTTAWQGRATTGDKWAVAIPEGMPLGRYEILVGLADVHNRGQRQRLLGDEDQRRRYRIGTLVVEGTKDGTVTGVKFVPPDEPYVPSTRWLANRDAVDFGAVKTNGAFRAEVRGNEVVVTPLPDGADFEVQLDVQKLIGHQAAAEAVEGVGPQGQVSGTLPHSASGGTITFTTRAADVAYRIRLK